MPAIVKADDDFLLCTKNFEGRGKVKKAFDCPENSWVAELARAVGLKYLTLVFMHFRRYV